MGIVVNANVSLQDSEDEKNITPSMSLAYHNGFAAYVNHIPDRSDRLSTSLGQVNVVSSGINTAKENLSFSNSTSASTSKPVKSVVSFRVFGNVEDSEGNRKGIRIYFDPTSRTVVAEEPCYADVEIVYSYGFMVIRYMPESTGANSYQYGTIRSRIGKNVGSFQVPSPEPFSGDWVELARVVSYYVIGEMNGKRGSYEMPKDFPTNLKHDTGGEIEEESSLKVERVHEVLKVDSMGRVMKESNLFHRLNPFENQPSYEPKYEFKKNSLPTEYSEAEKVINWSEISRYISGKYKEIKGV